MASSEVSHRLNLVLCGSDEAQKASISDLILGQGPHSPEPGSECVKREGEVSGRTITVVEVPPLFDTLLSEEEVMHAALDCVSLCNAGVHAFLLIIPVGPISDQDKGEMKKIQRIFSSKVNDHLAVVFMSHHGSPDSETEFIEHSTDIKNLLAFCKHRYILVETKTEKMHKQQCEKLLNYIDQNMETQPYSLYMYMKAQEERVGHDVQLEYKEELSKNKKEIQKLKRMLQAECEDDEPQDSSCLRIVLIGKTGNGKSATGNTILGRKEFETAARMASVTKVCRKAVGEVEGKSVAVVDTPGLFDTSLSNEEVQQEIVKCISLLAPGPHAFIIVLSVGRITKEELDTLELIKRIFGLKAAMYSIVLFTRGDDLEYETIQQYIENSDMEQINKLLRDCGNRFIVFNNREKSDRRQVSELIRQIEMMIESNASRYFTNEMFQEAEMSIKKKIEEILKEKEEEIATEKEKLETKYRKEMEDVHKRLKEEKQRADEEKLQMERRFTEKMEVLKMEFAEKDEQERKKQEMEDKMRSEEEKIQQVKWQSRINEVEKENKKQKAEFEKQLNDRDEEDKKGEEEYKQEKLSLINQQRHAMDELKKRQDDDLKMRDLEENRRSQEEENERHNWERKIKEAEREKKEIQEDLKRRQREWEENMKRKMRDVEIDDFRRKQRHAEELRAKLEEQNRIREKLESKMDEYRLWREQEKRQWKQAEMRESERKERENEEKKRAIEAQMKELYDQLIKMRKEDWERRKREDNEIREEERQRLHKLKEEIEREQQMEIKRSEQAHTARREKEEKEWNKMKKIYHHKMKEMKYKYEDEARERAMHNNEFNKEKEKEVQDLLKKIMKLENKNLKNQSICAIL